MIIENNPGAVTAAGRAFVLMVTCGQPLIIAGLHQQDPSSVSGS
jgi:hypothetical protein